MKAVPVVWDETRAITRSGSASSSPSPAAKGRDWFIGAITNDAPRELDLPLAFLGTGPFTAEIYADAPDAAANPKHTALDRRSLQASDTIHLKLAPGGGAAIRLHP
ncbi:MAG: glycoside hydrolase family 97 C-terminal domain-containing protein [Acidobacteriota bacterium]